MQNTTQINHNPARQGRHNTALSATVLALAMAVANTAMAANHSPVTSEVVIRTPGAGDVTVMRTIDEVPEAIAQSFVPYVDRVDGISANYTSCLEAAARLRGAQAGIEKDACRVALGGDKLDLLSDLQQTMLSVGNEFFGLVERIKREIEQIGEDIEVSEALVRQADTEIDFLVEGSRAYYEGLDPGSVSDLDESRLRQLQRELQLIEIDRRGEQKDLADLSVTRDDYRVALTAYKEWGFDVTESAKDLSVDIALAEEEIKDIKRDAGRKARLSGPASVPASLGKINGVFREVNTFLKQSAATDRDKEDRAQEASPILPPPDTAGSSSAYEALSNYFAPKQEVSQ